MIALGELLAVAVLGAWLLATAVTQLPGAPWQALRRRINFLNLLPTWSFFTSGLCAKDYHVCWRPVADGVAAGGWREIGAGGPRPAGSAVWHPQRRVRKAQLDLAFDLITLQSFMKLEPARLALTPAYRALRAFCAPPARAAGAAAFQFAILASHGRDSDRAPSVFFLSDIHTP